MTGLDVAQSQGGLGTGLVPGKGRKQQLAQGRKRQANDSPGVADILGALSPCLKGWFLGNADPS